MINIRGSSKPAHGLNIPESCNWRETSLIGFLHTPTKNFRPVSDDLESSYCIEFSIMLGGNGVQEIQEAFNLARRVFALDT